MECFEKTLNYSSPGHGGWGIVRVAALVPEAHLLFVCPSACFRHGALGAIQHGYKEKASYLYLTPVDIIEGYDDVVVEGVSELIQHKKDDFKILFIFVACIDDFIGTDIESICKQLSLEYKEKNFFACHMNPIVADTKRPPLVTTYNAMFSPLNRNGKKTDTVNLLGNFVGIPEICELFEVVRFCGMKQIKQITNYRTYTDFLTMSESKFNIVLSPIAAFTAENLDNRIGTRSIKTFISYDMDEVKKAYDILTDQMGGGSVFDFTEIIEETNREIELTLLELQNREIVVSEGAVLRPFSLAYALLKKGFHVTKIVAQQAIPIDKESFEIIRTNYPDVEIRQPQHYNAISRETQQNEKLSIGFEGAYLENCEYVVNLNGDEGMFGYYGIKKLMKMMREASMKRINLKELIEIYGAIV